MPLPFFHSIPTGYIDGTGSSPTMARRKLSPSPGAMTSLRPEEIRVQTERNVCADDIDGEAGGNRRQFDPRGSGVADQRHWCLRCILRLMPTPAAGGGVPGRQRISDVDAIGRRERDAEKLPDIRAVAQLICTDGRAGSRAASPTEAVARGSARAERRPSGKTLERQRALNRLASDVGVEERENQRAAGRRRVHVRQPR